MHKILYVLTIFQLFFSFSIDITANEIKTYVMCVGISKYKSRKVSNLKHPDNDAKAFAKLFEGRKNTEIKKRIKSFLKKQIPCPFTSRIIEGEKMKARATIFSELSL